jgi:hypothetical protein
LKWSVTWREGEVRTALRDTLQVHPCKLFVDILSPKVSQRATRLPLDIQGALIEDCGSNQWPDRPLIAIGRPKLEARQRGVQ